VRNLTAEITRQLGLPAGSAGVVVAGIGDAAAAAEAGVEEGDVIVELNRKSVRNINDYRKVTEKLGKKDDALLLVIRRGSRLYIPVKPG
jgi:serine protease Do